MTETDNNTKSKFSISMDPDLLDQIDAEAKKQNRNRSNMIEMLCRSGLKQKDLLQMIKK